VDAAAGIAALPLRDALTAGEAAVGGKAAGLARLLELSLPVPPAVVLPVGWAGSDGDVVDAARDLAPPYAVRSSAVGEDSSESSAAGQFETITGVRRAEQLPDAVRRCLASAGSERVRAYRGSGAEAAMAVVIQHQLDAGRSGVAFSIDPISGRDDVVVIEAVFGLGEGLVAGLITPDGYRVSPGGDVRARVQDKQIALSGSGARRRLPSERRHARTLRDDEAVAVAVMARHAHERLGMAVDLEFCFEGPRLWLLQCRPVTTLGRR
jgi:pyruvate,water dikinase